MDDFNDKKSLDKVYSQEKDMGKFRIQIFI